MLGWSRELGCGAVGGLHGPAVIGTVGRLAGQDCDMFVGSGDMGQSYGVV